MLCTIVAVADSNCNKNDDRDKMSSLDSSRVSLLLRDGGPEAGEDLAQREARVPVELGRLPPRHDGGGKHDAGLSITKSIPSLSLYSSLNFAFVLLTLFHI